MWQRNCNKIRKLFINILSNNRLIFMKSISIVWLASYTIDIDLMKISLLLLNILINNFQILLQLRCHITTIDF